jgi:hypothetical protein
MSILVGGSQNRNEEFATLQVEFPLARAMPRELDKLANPKYPFGLPFFERS